MYNPAEIIDVTLTFEPKRVVNFNKDILYGENREKFDSIVKHLVNRSENHTRMVECHVEDEIKRCMQERIPDLGDTLYVTFLDNIVLEFKSKEVQGAFQWLCTYTPENLEYDPSKVEVTINGKEVLGLVDNKPITIKPNKTIEGNENLFTMSNPHANLLGTSQFGYWPVE